MSNKKLTFYIILIILAIICAISIVYFMNRSNENAAVNLYKEIIDLTVSGRNGILDNREYISIDTKNLVDPINGKRLNENSIEEILKYCKKYNDKVYEKDYQELLDAGLGNNETLKGLLISMTLSNRSYNKGTIYSKIYLGTMASSMYTYYIKYNDSVWQCKDSGDQLIT